MPIEIYTYSNPYEIHEESFWSRISHCPHICSSQTLVNGLIRDNQECYSKYRLATLSSLLEELYKGWDTPTTTIQQYTKIDEIIRDDLLKESHLDVFEQKRKERINMLNAFMFNAQYVCQSIRTLFEFDIDINKIDFKSLNEEQKYIIEIYQRLLQDSHFMIKKELSEDEINQALKSTLTRNNTMNIEEVDQLNFDTIVIHGLHQFNPLILKMIEQLSLYKTVIMLFNYQEQYKNVYRTWLNVYDGFRENIQISSRHSYQCKENDEVGFVSNNLADCLGKLCDGQKGILTSRNDIEFLEFSSMTEFANYVADEFQKGVIKDSENPLTKMEEQVYAADSSVNDILRIYFPKQFGERRFLNYPLGHFFVALMHMWNPDNNCIEIKELNDVRNCLCANILYEEKEGQLVTIFNKIASVIEDQKTLIQIINRLLEVMEKYDEAHTSSDLLRLPYYEVSKDELEIIIHALQELEQLSMYFFEDFKTNASNFHVFYKKIKDYLEDILQDSTELDEQFKDIISRILVQLKTVDTFHGSASFDCLKSTISLYLNQEVSKEHSAKWIVRDFEQIDGDILRSRKNQRKTYHFACLSDEDINASKRKEFPWPLDIHFFYEAMKEVYDWKYEVYVTSIKEYKNFRRYALIYGLQFNCGKVKLSYIKNGKREEIKEPYYLLKLLGLKPKVYTKDIVSHYRQPTALILHDQNNRVSFDEGDEYRYQLCPYRFLLESLIENRTIYKDVFQQLRYLEMLLEESVQSQFKEETPINQVIMDELQKLLPHFPQINLYHQIDLIKKIKDRILNKKEKESMLEIQKDFLGLNLKRRERKSLNEDELNHMKLTKKAQKEVCSYCANRDICLAMYRINAEKRN